MKQLVGLGLAAAGMLLSACSDAGSDDGSSDGGPDTSQWVEGWCELKIGTPLDEAVDIMGPYTDDFLDDPEGAPQVQWASGAYDFTAFVDTDDEIYAFHANYAGIGDSELAKMPCVKADEYGDLGRIDD